MAWITAFKDNACELQDEKASPDASDVVIRQQEGHLRNGAGEKLGDLVVIRQLAEAGEIRTVIDRTYPLEDAAEAHRYYESGQRTGSVVITVRLDGK